MTFYRVQAGEQETVFINVCFSRAFIKWQLNGENGGMETFIFILPKKICTAISTSRVGSCFVTTKNVHMMGLK